MGETKRAPTLNEELKRLGMTKHPTRFGAYEIRRADGTVLCEGRTADVWAALSKMEGQS